MPTTVVARDGDTLCGIAIASGFHDCAPLRAEGANSDYTTRPLKRGDVVTIPDRTVSPETVATNSPVRIRVRRRPVPEIRFVHGSPDKSAREDAAIAHLNISNYKTDRAGANGLAAFSAAFGFNADAHQDPDTFKVEVVTPDGGGPLTIKLQALRPIYGANGRVLRHEAFTGAELTARSLDAEAQAVNNDPKRFRTRYLRLVVDPEDHNALPNQTLMVSDRANGNGGWRDRMEILDQQVLAEYELPGCSAGSNKCTLRKTLPVGGGLAKRRIRLAIHIFRTAVGGGTINGVTEQMVRRRTFRWFRRLYAQANMAPKLVGVDILDPPPADTIVVSNGHGRPATGLTGGGAASRITFVLDWAPGAAPPGSPPPPAVTVALAAGLTPVQACNRIAAALPANYNSQVQVNTRSTNAAHASCDIRVSHTSGARIRIRNENSNDTAMTVSVARVNIANVDVVPAAFAEMLGWTPEARRILRSAGNDNQLDFFVVGSIVGARGVAMVPANELAAPFRPPVMLRWASIIQANVMNGGDNDPFSFPHEAGHVLNDAFHADQSVPPADREMMAGGGTNSANAMDATKRISDDPVRPRYAKFDPAQASPGDFHTVALQPVDRIRRLAAPVSEDW